MIASSAWSAMPSSIRWSRGEIGPRRGPRCTITAPRLRDRSPIAITAYVVPAGHSLRFSVASADLQNAWPCASPAVHTLHRGAAAPSRVTLPLAPADAPKLPPPALTPSPHREPTASDFGGSSHTITHDLVNETVTVELERTGGLMPAGIAERPAFGESIVSREARSRYTVSRRDPAAAYLNAEHICTITRPEGEIRIEANESPPAPALPLDVWKVSNTSTLPTVVPSRLSVARLAPNRSR